MFDGLKKKLGRFSEDVEEDVDEDAVEGVEADATEEPAGETTEDEAASEQASATEEAAAEQTPVAEETVDAADEQAPATEEAAEEPAAHAPAETVPAADEADASAATADTTQAPEAGTADEMVGSGAETSDSASEESESDESEDESEVSEAPEADESEDEDDGRGLAEKAKLFATGKTVIDEDDLQAHLDDLELALLQSDVEMGVAQEILDGVEENLTGQTRRRLSSTGNLVQDALREALYDVISVGQFDFEQRIAEADKPMVIIFTGVNGVGKTTSIAKLSQYLEDRGFSSVLANGDTYRAGANEQLRKHAENLDRKFISHEQGSDPTAVIYDAVEYAEANDVDVVLGDTAGRLHTSNDLMAQLEKIHRVIEPDMTLFVDEAVAGQDAVNRAREFNEAAAIDGSVLTKADADPQGGAAISIAYVTGKPILFLGTGQGYDDLERFDPEAIVDSLLAE